jgi:hypothetical protein
MTPAMAHEQHPIGPRSWSYRPLDEPLPPSAIRTIGAEAIAVRRCLSVGEPAPSSTARPRATRQTDPPVPSSERLTGIPCITAGDSPTDATPSRPVEPEPLPAHSAEPFVPCATPVPFVPARDELRWPSAPPSRARSKPSVAPPATPEELPPERLALAPAAAHVALAPPDILHFCVTSPWRWHLSWLVVLAIALLILAALLATPGPAPLCW